MKTFFKLSILLFFLSIIGCRHITNEIKSPNGSLKINFELIDGIAKYSVFKNNKPLILTSSLGFKLQKIDLFDGFKLIDTEFRSYDETWEQPWGEEKYIKNNYSELKVFLMNKAGYKLNITFKAFNDGIAFRYEFPKQKNLADCTIMDELTEFALTGDHTTWWIPADYHSYEFPYTKSRLSEVDAEKFGFKGKQRDRYIGNIHAMNTPVTFKTDAGTYLAFHEANLTDYAGMTLALKDDYTLETELVPWADGTKVKAKLPFVSPWRTVIVSDDASGLLNSRMIINLNEPNKLEDVSWIKPMTYTGIWWHMHIGKNTWGTKVVPGSIDQNFSGGVAKHGANTENCMELIDFNSKHGIKGMLIEGWNTGWEYWGVDTLGFFDFKTPAADLDLQKVVNYAKEKGVSIIGHHETAGDILNYEKHMETAFKLYHDLGIAGVKTGYAGPINPEGEFHHGQFMVRHYRKVVETAAKYKVMIDAHEPIKDTGIRRTYPNMMTREGVRGMEYNAWSTASPVNHTVTLPFTRGLAGPMDYTPGIFDVLIEKYRDDKRVNSTIANQLALMVVLYSPLQMAADLQENYERFPDMFRFIEDVKSDWEVSIPIQAEIGEYITMARKNDQNWFIGSITNEESRSVEIKLDFLDEGQKYQANIYADSKDADWENNPMAYEITKMIVDRSSILHLQLAKGGGAAISLLKIN